MWCLAHRALNLMRFIEEKHLKRSLFLSKKHSFQDVSAHHPGQLFPLLVG